LYVRLFGTAFPVGSFKLINNERGKMEHILQENCRNCLLLSHSLYSFVDRLFQHY
jgi:hypothetical protein